MPGLDQRRLLNAIRDRWVASGIATDPTDRASAETAIGRLYAIAGLDAPRIRWFGSPRSLLLACARLPAVRRASLIDIIDRGRRRPALGSWFDIASWNEASAVRDAVARRVWQPVGRIVELQAGLATGEPGWQQSRSGLLGQHDAAMLALGEALALLSGHGESTAAAVEAGRLAGAAGWLLPLPGLALVSERHDRVRLDQRGRLHCEDGPALSYPDGWEIYGWCGTVVPRAVIAAPETITIAEIEAEASHTVRRALIERMGYSDYLTRSGAHVLHEDEVGRLWTKRFAVGEPLAIVEVENGTPEPDGSRRRYYLQVPPTCRTAREAVAWTYAMSSEDYLLKQRT